MTTPLRIVLPGGSGQVGNILSRYFHARGHDVVVLARRVTRAPWRVVNWDGATLGNWTSELENADVLINLAGRSVDCRYTAANRRAILRTETELVLKSRRVIPGRLLEAGFQFQFPEWVAATQNLVGRWRAMDA